MHLAADLALVVHIELGSSILPRLPAAVSFRGVKQSDAALNGIIHDPERGIFIDLPAESGTPQADSRDGDAGFPKDSCFHAARVTNRRPSNAAAALALPEASRIPPSAAAAELKPLLR